VAVLLALGSALAYGVSDYVGGRASRRQSPVTVATVAELTLFALTLVIVPATADGLPAQAAIVWSMIGGVAGTFGILGLYAALSRGNMTVVAPITGIVAAVLPVFVGVATGERPGQLATVGIVVAIVSVALIGGIVDRGTAGVDMATVVLSLVVGAAFGSLFIAYSRTGDDSGLWPLLVSRFLATPALVVVFLVVRRKAAIPQLDRGALEAGMTVGALILLANALYLLSTREGLLSIVAVLVSLYPASTVALAAALDHERPTRWQAIGMVLAATAVTMISVGA
jgi:drug/metabolite transporter (DMT)-like permease